MDDYPDIGTTIANLEKEQNTDPAKIKQIKWLETNFATTEKINSAEKEQKYLSKLRRSFSKNRVFYKKDLEHDGITSFSTGRYGRNANH